MRKMLLGFLTTILWSCPAYSQDVSLIYSDMKFNVPSGYSVIGSTDLAGGLLAFRYGDERGKKYIALTDVTSKPTDDFGCQVGEFYNELFTPTGMTNCNKEYLADLSKALFEDATKKVWRGGDVVINYLRSENKPESLIFVCKENGRTVKVESDFLAEDGFQRMFATILGNKP